MTVYRTTITGTGADDDPYRPAIAPTAAASFYYSGTSCLVVTDAAPPPRTTELTAASLAADTTTALPADRTKISRRVRKPRAV